MTEKRVLKSEEEKSVFFVGVGGISMSSLAMLAQAAGKRVGGCDRTENEQTRALRAQGVAVYDEKEPQRVADYDRVVYTLAVPRDHSFLVEAQGRGIPCESRPQYLGRLMQAYQSRIGVAGTHGKSSVTAMLSQIYLEAGKDPTVLCGATLHALEGRAYRIGSQEHLIFEACEYRDAFLSFAPTTAVLLNLEHDHVDYFADLAQMEQSFLRYARCAQHLVYCADDPRLCHLAQECDLPKTSYGMDTEADYTATDVVLRGGTSRFSLCRDGRPIATVGLKVGGRYNVQNTLAAAATALSKGIGIGRVVAGLQSYVGIGRRMECLGRLWGAAVYSDYAHHPTEVRAALSHARLLAEQRGGRLLCVFQSHTYSRSRAFFSHFATALQAADRVWILPIYAAREAHDEQVSAQTLAQASGGQALPDFAAVKAALAQAITEQDVVVLMGAGDVDCLRTCLPIEKEQKN